MMGRTHAITGAVAAVTFAAATNTIETTPIAAYLVAYFCSLLPDLDQHAAMAARYSATKPAHLILKNFRHRTFTHSFAGVALFSVFAWVFFALIGLIVTDLSPAWTTMAIVGYASHLVADAFNKQGMMLFYPFKPFGREWWSIPVPRPWRISTIHDVESGVPWKVWHWQANIHTEKWFFMYPVYALAFWVLWHNGAVFAAAAYDQINAFAGSLPGAAGDLAVGFLR